MRASLDEVAALGRVLGARSCRGPNPTRTRRSCSPPARPDPRRASRTRTAGSRRCATRSGRPTASARTARSWPRSRRSSCSVPHSVRRAPARTWTSPRPGTLTAAALAQAVRGDRRRGRVRVARGAARTWSGRPTDLTGDDREALARVRLFLSAGAPVRPELLESAVALMPNADAHTPYGMTESLLVTDVSLDELRAAGAGDGVCVGRPVPGARVAISALDPTARPPVRPHRARRDGRGPGLGAARQGALRRPLADAGRVGARRRLAPHRRRRAPRRGRSAVDRGPARARPGHRRGRGHARRSRAPGAGGRRRARRGGRRRRPAGHAAGRGRRRDRRSARPRRRPGARHGRAGGARADARRGGARRAALPTDVRHNSKVDRTRVAAWAEKVLAGERAGL